MEYCFQYRLGTRITDEKMEGSSKIVPRAFSAKDYSLTLFELLNRKKSRGLYQSLVVSII
jgi:hypothetical protein